MLLLHVVVNMNILLVIGHTRTTIVVARYDDERGGEVIYGRGQKGLPSQDLFCPAGSYECLLVPSSA